MTDHLPECWASDQIDRLDPLCLCDRLRACEQRVLRDYMTYSNARRVGYEQGYEKGVQAARDAVADLPHDTYCVTRDENYQRPCNCPVDDALAAIDALRGES